MLIFYLFSKITYKNSKQIDFKYKEKLNVNKNSNK